MLCAAGEGSLSTVIEVNGSVEVFFLLNLMSPLHRLCTEKGLPHYFPGYADVRPTPTVSGVVTAHASARQRREW